MGIVVIQNITMAPIWSDVLDAINSATVISSYPVIFTAAFAVGVSVPVASLALAAKVASRGNLESTLKSTLKSFASFGYTLIPLDVAAHVAHNLFHLLAEGNSVFYTVGALFGGHPSGSPALVGNATIQVLQFILLPRARRSLYPARRIAHRRYLILPAEAPP